MKTLGPYTIQRLLGSGTMGKVYKVLIPVLKKTAALKLYSPAQALIDKTSDQSLKEQFINEAVQIANIRHPNIVQVWHINTNDEPAPFYLMEFFCRNLGIMIGEGYWADSRTRVMAPERAAGYTLQLLEGLACLHDADVIHRDIKPFNLMISDAGILKIADFGLSKRRGERPYGKEKDLDIGTPFYAAPEQLSSPEDADHRSDLYSVGVMLYRMLTGVLPGPDSPSPSSLVSMVDRNWDLFIEKALHPSPSQRFPTAESMAQELENLRKELIAGKENDCMPPPEHHAQAPSLRRSHPARILYKHARKTFGLNPLNQPEIEFSNQFKHHEDGIILDQATGLLWQQSGSRYAMTWNDANLYAQKLCDKKLGGKTLWRLPTIDELLTLLHPPGPAGACLHQIFSSLQTGLWSADTRSKKSAWAIDIEMGFVGSCDFSDYHFIKAVCPA